MTIKPLAATIAALAVMALAPAAALAGPASPPSGETVLTTTEPGPQRSCDQLPEGCDLPEPPDGCPGCPPDPKPQPCGEAGTVDGNPLHCDFDRTTPPGNDWDPSTRPSRGDVRADAATEGGASGGATIRIRRAGT